MKKKQEFKVVADITEVAKAMKKVKRLRRLLKEANSLADELASKEIDITLKM